MLMDLAATIVIGVAAAGVVLIVNRLLGGRLPKWLLPAAAGLAMLAFTIWNEYSWFGRTVAQLPATTVVALAPGERMLYRPWTYAAPLVTRYIALDRGEATPAGAAAAPFEADVYIVSRWAEARGLRVAIDCSRRARADLFQGAALAADGNLKGTDWAVDEGDPLVAAACDGG